MSPVFYPNVARVLIDGEWHDGNCAMDACGNNVYITTYAPSRAASVSTIEMSIPLFVRVASVLLSHITASEE